MAVGIIVLHLAVALVHHVFLHVSHTAKQLAALMTPQAHVALADQFT